MGRVARSAPLMSTPVTVSAQPSRLTQAQRRELAEQRLLDAALALVAQRGSTRLTLAEVGEAAGYSRGLPAHRFGSKLGLLKALAGHIHRRFQDEMRRRPRPAEGLAQVQDLLAVYFGRTDASWTTTRALLVMMTDAFMADSELADTMMEYNRQAVANIERSLRRGIELGQIAADVEPRTYAVMILGTMRGVMMQRLIDAPDDNGERLDLQRERDEMARTLDRLLSPAC